MRICHMCNNEVEDRQVCPTCTANIPLWKAPEDMSVEERLAEMKVWYEPHPIVEVPINMLHTRIERLVGRPLQLLELIEYEALKREISGEIERPTQEQVFMKITNLLGEDRTIFIDPSGKIGKNN